LAEVFGVSDASIYNWLKQDRIDRSEIEGLSTDQALELATAKRRIRQLKTELAVARKVNEVFLKEWFHPKALPGDRVPRMEGCLSSPAVEVVGPRAGWARLRGRRAWRVRDAPSDSYARVGYRRTVFRRESPLSDVERDCRCRGGRSRGLRGCSRAWGPGVRRLLSRGWG
jgi:hypothetical protein